MNIALLGYGTVGKGVDEITKQCPDLSVRAILSRRQHPEIQDRETFSFEEILKDPAIDTVAEVIGGTHPAYEYLMQAIAAKKHVVTANKAVVAAYYESLTAAAKENGVSFRCTAAVGGGISWLTALERSRKTDRIIRISGIMNGTTNYILSEMEAGASFDEALSEAQALGYAEKDPTADLMGYDARRKIVISANIAFGAVLSEEDIPVFGIEAVRSADFEAARSLNATIRLIASAEKTREGMDISVLPVFTGLGSQEAGVRSNYNCFSLVSEHAGLLSFCGQGAGRYPTAQNVINDLQEIHERRPGFYTDSFVPETVRISKKLMRYYVRTSVPDCFLSEIRSRALPGGGILTAPVCREDFLLLAARQKQKDPSAFFAEVSEDLC